FSSYYSFFFFFNDTATTEIYTLSLHDALPISGCKAPNSIPARGLWTPSAQRSEEHTSELQSHLNLVCRLLLEKKKKKSTDTFFTINKKTHVDTKITETSR